MANGQTQQTTTQTTAPAEGTNLTAVQTNEAWWKLIGRYDFYFGSVNTKATLLIAFNTFVAGGIVLKWQDIKTAFGEDYRVFFLVACLFLLATIGASLVSLWFTFRSVNPFLGSPSEPTKYHSLIFFNDVAKLTKEDYLTKVESLKDTELRKDLAYQAHALAGGLGGKFDNQTKAIWWILYVQIPAIGLLTLVLAWIPILPPRPNKTGHINSPRLTECL